MLRRKTCWEKQPRRWARIWTQVNEESSLSSTLPALSTVAESTLKNSKNGRACLRIMFSAAWESHVLSSVYYDQQGEWWSHMTLLNLIKFFLFVHTEVVLSFWDLEVKEMDCWLTTHREIQLKAPLVHCEKNWNRMEFLLSRWSQAAFLLNRYLNRQYLSVSLSMTHRVQLL